VKPIRNFNRAEAHSDASLAVVPHYEIVGAPGTGTFVRAIARTFPDATRLYLVGAQFTPAIRRTVSSFAESMSTVIPAGRGWPDNWYETTRLRMNADVFEALGALADEFGVPALGKTGALFRHDELVAEWLATPGETIVDLLEITAGISAGQRRRLEVTLSATFTPVAPAF
jgi:hypothetical protein